MGTDNLIFLEFLEWFDESGRELVHRLPEQGSADIKYGAQLTVRDCQYPCSNQISQFSLGL